MLDASRVAALAAALPGMAPRARWTVNDTGKKPLDMRAYMEDGRRFGARFRDRRSLAALDTVLSAAPSDATNVAYALDGSDGFVVLDIEAKCPPDMRDSLLRMALPLAVWSEHSMSGTGIHVVLPPPEGTSTSPTAVAPVLNPGGDWEILVHSHFVTFTMDGPVAPPPAGDSPSWADTWNGVMRGPHSSRTFGADTADIPMPAGHEVRASALAALVTPRPVQDFGGDMSRWEMSILDALALRLPSVGPFDGWDDGALVSLVAEAAAYIIPHRAKHDTMRCGLPFLVWRASQAIGYVWNGARPGTGVPGVVLDSLTLVDGHETGVRDLSARKDARTKDAGGKDTDGTQR